ncbi:MFS transporter, partial [Dehalococcoidia bacterium]|nr:MFS transporter [Dehalococcoidia bacterium]
MVTFGAASSRYKWMVFSVVSAGVFMAIQQTTMVAVALPDMSADFGVDLAVAQWVILIYLLVIGAVTIPMGRAADLFGRKGIYQAGVAMFVVGSLLCLVAQDIVWLLFARGVQAIGSASLQANGLAINFSTFPEGQRGRV